MPGKITYNSINVDLQREWNDFQAPVIANNAETVAQSGKSAITHFFQQTFGTARKNHLTGHEQTQVDDFYAYASQGNTFAIERDRNLGAFIDFEGKSLDDNDGNSGTFTRSGTATYIDPSTNLLTSITADNTARFPGGKYGSGVLVEAARTNLCSESRDFGTTWVASNITVSGNTTETPDLIGGNGADKLTATAANGTLTFTTSTAISTDDAVFAVWLKSNTGDVSVTLRINSTSAGEIASDTVTVNPEGTGPNCFTRHELVYESAGSVAGNWEFVIEMDTNSTVIYADQAQFEAGSGVLYPTADIATATTTGSRGTEALTYSTTNVFNQKQGSIAFWLYPLWAYNKNESNLLLFQVGETSASADQFVDIRQLSSGSVQFLMRQANSSTAGATATYSVTGLTQRSWDNHFVFTWDVTSSNGLNIYYNGALGGTSSSDPFTPTDIGATYAIGCDTSEGNSGNAAFDEVLIMKRVLTATEINHMYNLGRGQGIRRNRWSSALLTDFTQNPVEQFQGRYNLSLQWKEAL